MAARPMMVCVFLRGAADGLSLVVPHADPRYYALRPTLAIPRPDDGRAASKARALDLDGQFGFHPSLSGLLPLYRAGELAIVHAVGSDDQTRSHFEAQDRMEHANPRGSDVGGGWLARHLATRPGGRPSSLAAVAIGSTVPESLRGAAVSVLESANDYRLGEDTHAFAMALHALYSAPESAARPYDGALLASGREALDTLDRLRAIPSDASGARYPEGQLGRALKEIARLARADLGVEVACCDYDGWDTHFVADQLIPGLASHLGDSLRAFREDLGDAMDRVLVVVMTEFGRRAYENTSLGTDHGRASVMFLMGAGVRGGRVVTDWPGLDDGRLEEPGDLAVTIDYRAVLAEIVRHRLENPRAAEVFPGLDAVERLRLPEQTLPLFHASAPSP
ncbi:MAG: DUF1501 domain-containing protein [Polyangiaceae bacterium]